MAEPAGATHPLASVLPGILARAKVVATPYPFGLSDDDNLRVTSVNAVTGVTLEVHYRQLLRNGEIKAGVFKHMPNSNRTAKTDDFNMAGGFVTNISVFATGGSPLIGQTFVIVQIIRGMGSVAIIAGTMLQGYVTTTQGLGWPGSAIVSSTEGEPVIRTIVGATPAAGNGPLETVPTGARWELLTWFATATKNVGPLTSITPSVQLNDPFSNSIGQFSASAAFQNVTSQSVSFGSGITPSAAAGAQVCGSLPTGMKLPAGATIGMPAPNNIANWSAPIYSVREWQEVG